MLKGLRWPLLVLILAGGLLVLVILTRPEDRSNTNTVAAATETATPTPSPSSPSVIETAATPVIQALPPDEPSPPPENILVEALVGEIRKLNPLLATYNPVDRDITTLIFEGLTDTNEYGEIIPDLAESWTVSTNGLEYIFLLRDDVLWQDGLPFTAEDVVLTIHIMSDPLFPGAASLSAFWQTVEVDALDTYLVRFRLTQPLASFPDQLRIGIVPAHVFAGTPIDQLDQHPFNLSPIGTGPYQIETLTASEGHIDGIQLRVAPVYRQRPEGAEGYALDRIIFRTYSTADAALEAYRKGEINSISTVPYNLQTTAVQLPGLSLYTAVEPHVGVLIYNWQSDAMRLVRNPRARLALAHAVDPAALVTQHLLERAIPADSPLLPGSWAYKPGLAWPAYDLTQAQALLDMAEVSFEAPPAEETPSEESEPPSEGETEAEPATTPEPATGEDEDTSDPTPSSLIMLVPDDPAFIALADDIVSGWEQLGLILSVEPVDTGTLHARLEAGEFDAALIELSFEPSADPDPYVFWHQGQYGSGQNYGGMDDRRISEALEMARRDPTGVNRVIHYHQFQELFAERMPALVLYYPLYTYAANARLEGIQFGFWSSPSDRFRNVQEWAFTAAVTD